MSFCPNCGAQLPEGSTFCPNCGQKMTAQSANPVPAPVENPTPAANPAPAAQQSATKPCPENYLAFSILTTVFCCVPFGVVGIVKSAQVSSKYSAGDYEGAVMASKDAKKWSQIALICGLVGILLYIIFVVIAAFAA